MLSTKMYLSYYVSLYYYSGKYLYDRISKELFFLHPVRANKVLGKILELQNVMVNKKQSWVA